MTQPGHPNLFHPYICVLTTQSNLLLPITLTKKSNTSLINPSAETPIKSVAWWTFLLSQTLKPATFPLSCKISFPGCDRALTFRLSRWARELAILSRRVSSLVLLPP